MDIKAHHRPTCENCLYYQAQEKGIGACHRYPPRFSGDSAAVEFHHWKFPLVSGHNWCGEFHAVSRMSAPLTVERQ